ncbi:Galectin, partial [Tyrophagus putrescentiae]
MSRPFNHVIPSPSIPYYFYDARLGRPCNIYIAGLLPSNSVENVSINLANASDFPRLSVPFHLSIRPHERTLVRNSYLPDVGLGWQTEERHTRMAGFPFGYGGNFDLMLSLKYDKVSTALYGNFVLVYLAENENLDFKFKFFHQNPNSLTHQVVPPSMWPQMDVVYAIVVLTTTANYITFVRRPLYTGGKYEVLAKKSLNASKWIPVLILFVYGLLLVETFHWALIHQCAKVATGNRCLKKANARFYKLVFLSSQQIGHLKNNQSSVFQIKAEWLQLHHRLHPFAVHLLDSYRITSKTFYLVSIYTALFFMI